MKGLAVSSGIGMGRAFLYLEPEIIINKENIKSIEKEIERLESALERAKEEIDNLYSMSLESLGEEESEIFTAHKMILEDPEFIGKIKDKINREKKNAQWAVDEVTDSYMALFENIEDEYIKARREDLKDVSKRVLKILLQIKSTDLLSIDGDVIFIGKDLPPSLMAKIDKKNIKGIVTELGGITSHSFIIARSLEIPAISGVVDVLNSVKRGDFIIVDGDIGHIIINPSQDEKEYYIKKQEEDREFKKNLRTMIGKDSLSKDGYRVEISGNIGGVEDIDQVLKNDGEGVGLFRTEFLFMDRKSMPSEEEQFQSYKTVAERLRDKSLIIRTLDVGGDKEISYLNLPKSMNPFLGYRAIRISLDRLDIFKSQLRAILRASHYGNIKIMFPMISSIEELRKAKDIVEQVKFELKSENIPFNNALQIGIMVEIPAVAVHSRAFAEEVDFFSIGTNDLIQYSLAVDRGETNVAHLYSPYHPAVLRLIQMTIENGHQAGIRVGMCGDLAENRELIPIFLAMGLDEFSMNPSSILKTRYIIRNTCKKEMEEILEEVLNLSTSEDIKNLLISLQ